MGGTLSGILTSLSGELSNGRCPLIEIPITHEGTDEADIVSINLSIIVLSDHAKR